MVKRLSEINRTAVFAWSPGQQAPLIAAGTAAGALDDSFSNASELELFKLDLKSSSPNGVVSAGKISTTSRFNKLVWGNASSTSSHGIIAGGLETGELTLWDAGKIIGGKSDEEAKIMANATHTGQIRGLDFNKFQTNLLASAGSNNEVYIWDLSNPNTPYTPGPKSQKLDDITSVGWNGQVAHILATSSSTGHTVVWDLRNRKEVMTLSAPNDGSLHTRKSTSSVVWHPDVATQLVTAAEDDSNPVVTLWDLRHAHSPEKVLAGHTKGVLSVSWCRQDSDLLMSCGKDCKTLMWNPNSGELLGELAHDTNWTFQTEWCPRNPDLLASASFNGKIGVYSLQNSETEDTKAPVVDTTNDDPFSAAMNASAAASAGSSAFALRHPPKWLRCPVGASFGFGGKLVSFNNKAGQAATQAAANLPPGQASTGQSIPRTITINSIVTDKETVQRSVELETALEQQSVEQLVEERVQRATEKDEKESWEVIKTLLAEDAREQLMNYLGFQKSEVIAAVAKATAGKKGLSDFESTEEPSKEEAKEEDIPAKDLAATEVAEPAATTENKEPATEEKEEGDATPEIKESTSEETPVDNSASDLFGGDTSDDFFIQTQATNETPMQSDDGGVSSANAISSAIKHEPLQLYAEGSSETDRLITRAVVLGDFESAVDLCISFERFSDALLFAICGGGDLLARTQQAYFKHQSKSTSYLRLLESIVNEDLNSVVANVSLEEWTSVIVVLCTFAKSEDFRPLCEALGGRLEEAWNNSDVESAKEFRRHATLCYLAAGNLGKVARIWIAEQEEMQKNNTDDVKASSLQLLIEKVTIFRKVISFEDPALFETSESKMSYEYPLSPLYDKYCEYAELLAAQGKLTTALTYLSLTPIVYRKTTFDKLSVVRDRVYQACPVNVASQFVQPAPAFENHVIGSDTAYATETQPDSYAQPEQISKAYQQGYSQYRPTATTTQQSPYAPVRSPVASNNYAPLANTYAPNANTYAPTAASNATSYAPTTAIGAPTNAYQPESTPSTGTATSAYGYNHPTNAYGQPAQNSGYSNNNNYSSPSYGNDPYGYNNSSAAARPTIPAPPPIGGVPPSPRSQVNPLPPPPKKAEGAWNDPPMALANVAGKKMKSPKMSTTPTKRVTSPFPNQPSAVSFVGNSPHQQASPFQQQQQQQHQLPPPPQGAFPPPPMSRPPQGGPPMGPPRGGMAPPPPQQQHQQQQPRAMAPPPPMNHQQHPPPMGHAGAPPPHLQQGPSAPPMGGPPRNNPLPPPPMNAIAPSPLTQKRGPPPPQGGIYQPQRMN